MMLPDPIPVMESWDTRERERQQTLRDRVRDTRRRGNPHLMQPIEDDLIDVTGD